MTGKTRFKRRTFRANKGLSRERFATMSPQEKLAFARVSRKANRLLQREYRMSTKWSSRGTGARASARYARQIAAGHKKAENGVVFA